MSKQSPSHGIDGPTRSYLENPPDSYADFVLGFQRLGPFVELRAGIAVAEALRPLWEGARPKDESPSKTLAALVAHYASPTEETLEAVGSNRFDAYYDNEGATLAAAAVTHLATALFYGDEPLSSCAIMAAEILGEEKCRLAICEAFEEA